jgi:hypothetical protein
MVGRRLRKTAPLIAATLVAVVLTFSGFAAGTAVSSVNRRAIFKEVLKDGPEWAHSMMKKQSLCDNPKETKHWSKRHAVLITACGLK